MTGDKIPPSTTNKKKTRTTSRTLFSNELFFILSLFLYKGNITSAMEHDIAQKTVKQQQEQGFKEH